jgi:hypothetical protein
VHFSDHGVCDVARRSRYVFFFFFLLQRLGGYTLLSSFQAPGLFQPVT